ncbi:MAG: response regulator [Polyangiaceae bacterium]|nr:response regulator [Polyangiaceae bacterium]
MRPPMGARILVVDDSPTIRQVVASILASQDYEPVTAEDGQDALIKIKSGIEIDLVLLDFVMPRMNGYQFCRELRANPDRANTPVVLMSAKGDKIRGQFVQQTGAIDAITKPFDARGLIAVVEGALKKHQEGRGPAVPEPNTMPDESTIAEPLSASQVVASDDPALRRVQTAMVFAANLVKLVTPELASTSGVSPDTVNKLGEAVKRALTPENMGVLTSLLRTLDFGENTQEVLAGDVSVISIAEILQLLHLQHQTGGLVISNAKSEITLFVREGNIDFARSRGVRDEFLLGRYLVESAAITREDLDTVLGQRSGSRRLLGDVLKELGLVEPEAITHAITRQTSELVYEVVRWKTGRFTFTVGIPPEVSTVRLGLSTSALVMEGFRRVDEWRLIEGTFDFEEVIAQDEGAIERHGDESKLTKRELAVLDAIDGQRTVREVVDFMEGSSFEVCKIIYQFLNSRLVRRRSAN